MNNPRNFEEFKEQFTELDQEEQHLIEKYWQYIQYKKAMEIRKSVGIVAGWTQIAGWIAVGLFVLWAVFIGTGDYL